jgi:hypothetical protein
MYYYLPIPLALKSVDTSTIFHEWVSFEVSVINEFSGNICKLLSTQTFDNFVVPLVWQLWLAMMILGFLSKSIFFSRVKWTAVLFHCTPDHYQVGKQWKYPSFAFITNVRKQWPLRIIKLGYLLVWHFLIRAKLSELQHFCWDLWCTHHDFLL